MARYPLFIDDPTVSQILDEAGRKALSVFLAHLPDLTDTEKKRLAADLETLLGLALTGDPPPEDRPLGLSLIHGRHAFGDPFQVEHLPLPRAGTGYGVQYLGTDTLLDRKNGVFLAVRDPGLQAIHATFESARCAAQAWLVAHKATTESHPLAVVPLRYDERLERHILIYGVLTETP